MLSPIACAECCRYQRDGYCTLEESPRLTLPAEKSCAYFCPREDSAPGSGRGLDGLVDGADAD